MRWAMRLRFSLLIAAILTPLFANADTIYTYQGNPFTQFNNSGNPPLPTGITAISGFVDFTSPLPSNLGPQSVSPLAFSFTDGATTITQATATVTAFRVGTDGSGNINFWEIDVIVPTATGQVEFQFENFPNVLDINAYQNIPFTGQSFAVNTNSPGIWSTGPPATVPEPATLVLLVAGCWQFHVLRDVTTDV